MEHNQFEVIIQKNRKTQLLYVVENVTLVFVCSGLDGVDGRINRFLVRREHAAGWCRRGISLTPVGILSPGAHSGGKHSGTCLSPILKKAVKKGKMLG